MEGLSNILIQSKNHMIDSGLKNVDPSCQLILGIGISHKGDPKL